MKKKNYLLVNYNENQWHKILREINKIFKWIKILKKNQCR